ncbi:MAG: hypothetical protein OSB10_10020 [Planctomycetota bacterium]|nr:hypothetical protein [Planctomycetota bacterium]
MELAVRSLVANKELRASLGKCAMEQITALGLTWRANAIRVTEVAAKLIEKSA